MRGIARLGSAAFRLIPVATALCVLGCTHPRGSEREPGGTNREVIAAAWANSLKPEGGHAVGFQFATNGVACCEILLPARPTPQDETAARELAKWLKSITGADFTVFKERSKPLPGSVVSIGLTETLSTQIPKFGARAVGDEGYAVEVKGQHLFLWGGPVRGSINAVLALLEEDLGCRWYSSQITRIPKRPSLDASIALRTYRPPFVLRDPFTFQSMNNIEWSLLNRTSPLHVPVPAAWGGRSVYYPSGWWVHSAGTFMPEKEYFASHPEYFMLDSDGTRSGRQICPSNPDVLRIAIEKALAVLRGSPEFTMISISKNDLPGVCRCPTCKALIESEESEAAAYLLFVNKVAEGIEAEFPRVRVSTLAYLDTLDAPKHIKLRHNVVIMVCTGAGACSFVPKRKDARFDAMLDTWLADGCGIHVWDYAVNFCNYMQPYPSLPVIAANLQYYGEKKIDGVLTQNAYSSAGTERGWMRSWVLAKLLWDPTQDLWTLQQDYIRGCYGKAAPPIEAYNRMLHRAGLREDWSGLEPGFVEEARRLFDEAERLADDDTVRRLVREDRLPVDCGLMDRLRDQLNHAPEKVDIKQYLALLDSIETSVAEFKVAQYAERIGMAGWLTKMRKSVAVPDGESRRLIDMDGGKAEFVRLSAAWDFRPDPSAVGERDRWFDSGSTNDWRLFRTDLGIGWEAQGFTNVTTWGWFRKDITIPAAMAGRPLHLFFEACDEDAWVWLDGKPLGEYSCASTGLWPEQIWTTPFAIDLTGRVAAGSHQLTVKVLNRADQGGIYRPVYLVASDVPLTAARMKQYVDDRFSEFMPRLKQVKLNGNVLFKADTMTGQTVAVDSSRPVKLECDFENVGGDCPYTIPVAVFVHANRGDTTVTGGNYFPRDRINDWRRGATYSLTETLDFSKQKGQTLTLYLGLYLSEMGDRLRMKNEMDGAQRVSVGTLSIQ